MLRLKLNGDRGDFEQLVGGLGCISGVEGILSAFTPDRAGFIFIPEGVSERRGSEHVKYD